MHIRIFSSESIRKHLAVGLCPDPLYGSLITFLAPLAAKKESARREGRRENALADEWIGLKEGERKRKTQARKRGNGKEHRN